MRKPVLFLIALCSLLHAQEAPKPTVLVAWEKTKFKQALVSEVEKQLTAAGCAVTRVDHSKHGLDSIKAASFDAVFITNSGAMNGNRRFRSTRSRRHPQTRRPRRSQPSTLPESRPRRKRRPDRADGRSGAQASCRFRRTDPCSCPAAVFFRQLVHVFSSLLTGHVLRAACPGLSAQRTDPLVPFALC